MSKTIGLSSKGKFLSFLNLMKHVIVPEDNRLIGEDFILQQDNAQFPRPKLF